MFEKNSSHFFLLNGVVVFPLRYYDPIKGRLSDSYSIIGQV